MTKNEEGYTIFKVKIPVETKALLIKLAGGERKVGVYLAEMAPILVAAQAHVDRAKMEAQARQLAISILQSNESEQR